MRSLRAFVPAAARPLLRRAIVDAFHVVYWGKPMRTWRNTYWLDVPVSKCPLDLWIYQELLTRIRPDLVIETGTYFGGSALFFASCMDMLDAGRVLTIDVAERPGLPEHDRISYLTGSSVDPLVVERVREEAAGLSPIMVVLDSDHSKAHVLAELHAYAPLVTSGSYLIVEDTNLNGHPVQGGAGAGPHEAVEEFLASSPGFTRDRECEKFFMTFNPGGYLRRFRD